MYDTIIIGAGLSGLAGGVRFAHFGKKVCILEQHDRVGGLNSFYSKGGYNFDVGLHAMTNYSAGIPKSTPLPRLCRQLRISLDSLRIFPQKVSQVVFPDTTLEFSNDFELFTSCIRDSFPDQIDNFMALVSMVQDFDIMDPDAKPISGRKVLESYITDQKLAQMILLPLFFYGSPEEDDIELTLLVTLFRSVYLEGLGRPHEVRPLLNLLVDKYTSQGGELRLNAGVRKIIVSNDRIKGVELLNGEILESKNVISATALIDTLALCPEATPSETAPEPSSMSVVEMINVVDDTAENLGTDVTMIFYNKNRELKFRKPETPVDLGSGIICYCDNFQYDKPKSTHMVRFTHLANPDFWLNAEMKLYYESKKEWFKKSLESSIDFGPDIRDHVLFTDMYTPRTVKQYTGHPDGALYGCARKIPSGKLAVDGLFICGTDQGFYGIVGAMTSGIIIANSVMSSR